MPVKIHSYWYRVDVCSLYERYGYVTFIYSAMPVFFRSSEDIRKITNILNARSVFIRANTALWRL